MRVRSKSKIAGYLKRVSVLVDKIYSQFLILSFHYPNPALQRTEVVYATTFCAKGCRESFWCHYTLILNYVQRELAALPEKDIQFN